jgi:hypothetical protein
MYRSLEHLGSHPPVGGKVLSLSNLKQFLIFKIKKFKKLKT